MLLLTPQQFLEYEDLKNDTGLEYEEYEIYEDDFEFAERERAETMNVGVSLLHQCHCHFFRLLVLSDF